MLRKNYVSKVVKVLKQGDKFICNPQVITDKWLDDGQIVYGEPVTGEAAAKAREIVKSCTYDMSCSILKSIRYSGPTPTCSRTA